MHSMRLPRWGSRRTADDHVELEEGAVSSKTNANAKPKLKQISILEMFRQVKDQRMSKRSSSTAGFVPSDCPIHPLTVLPLSCRYADGLDRYLVLAAVFAAILNGTYIP